MTDPLDRARFHARKWLDTLSTCPAGAQASAAELRAAFEAPLPETGRDAAAIIDDLAAKATPGLNANASGRFFAWVMAGSLPSATAADWLVSAWDQNVGLFSVAPAAAIKWPIMLLVLETGTLRAFSPKTCLHATVSTRSFTEVLVPCAFTYWIWVRSSPASRKAMRIQAMAPRPSG